MRHKIKLRTLKIEPKEKPSNLIDYQETKNKPKDYQEIQIKLIDY